MSETSVLSVDPSERELYFIEMVHDYYYVTDIYANCTVSVATPIYFWLTENVQDAVNKE